MAASKLGILGGTFNPIHMGHLILAQNALESFDLARVLFIPCCKPPHKGSTGLASARDRMAMVESAIEGDLRFEASDMEIQRGGVSYAVDTLRELKVRYPGQPLHFIVGSDTLTELHLWKDVYEVLELCTVVTLRRPPVRGKPFSRDDMKLDPPWPDRLMQNVVNLRQIDISSSDIRHRQAEGMSIRYLVPPGVEMYIVEHHLYVK